MCKSCTITYEVINQCARGIREIKVAPRYTIGIVNRSAVNCTLKLFKRTKEYVLHFRKTVKDVSGGC